ncbi:TPA: hypothetical protein R5O69_004410 [Enterobacter hormaechei]|nr:hypothetical protein [Enterobacter hormaechei]HED5802440.1 hypothetical protein [Enterobacter hormaechei]HED5821790.1 hypothetical protein [Enterobacter hormaechei]
MKLPSIAPYRPAKVTWPSSATPDYGGDVGLIIHDGSFPFFVSSTGKSVDLPDEIAEEIDPFYALAAKEFNPVRPKEFDGLALYGHLVKGYFFGRYAMRAGVAAGTEKMRGDLGMARATLMRVMMQAGMMHCDYDGRVWMAPSRPVLCDAQFGRQHSKWNGHPVITDQYVSRDCPKVPTFGALLTDIFVTYSPTAAISMRATEDQMENLYL